ncbi:hypothetical protein LJC61_03930 [Ruminococcaceae bacterium OttesenSCG-928-A16]|nr:hypothetical protein [Ruminococcaceae bacterium OttesenSCG-928-A16]
MNTSKKKQQNHNPTTPQPAPKKTLRDCARLLMELPVADTNDTEGVLALGIDTAGATNSQLIAIALFNKAKTGDVAAIKELRNLLGEDTPDDVGQWEELVRELQNAES